MAQVPEMQWSWNGKNWKDCYVFPYKHILSFYKNLIYIYIIL